MEEIFFNFKSKRRYYELKLGRWPVSNINSGLYFNEEEVEFIENPEHRKDKIKLETILNKSDLDDGKVIDSITVAVLQCAFLQHEL